MARIGTAKKSCALEFRSTRGANPNGPTKAIAGPHQLSDLCGGVKVAPGDLVVGDGDGVVVIEREKAASMLPLAAKKVEDERARISDIMSRRSIVPSGSRRAASAGVLADGETL